MSRVIPLGLLPALLLVAACSRAPEAEPRDHDRRLLVLGIDGMDPGLLQELMDAGRMPNFSSVAAAGTFVPLETSAPPQSPVAWSNFIVGADPGTHQIFDFIHRDPDPDVPGLAVLPYLSTSEVQPPRRDWGLSLGKWRIPFFGSRTVSLRQGTAFWDHLVEDGIPTAIYRVPANYPPPTVEGTGPFQCLCGMGTPDLLGTYGVFTLFTPDVPRSGREVAGGRLAPLRLREHRATATLAGPENYLRGPDEDGRRPELSIDFEVVRDPDADVVKIDIGDRVVLLNGGEWSDWIPIRFETGIPGAAVLQAAQLPTRLDAMVRFYLKRVHPEIELYVTPLNLDPLAPVNPVGQPDDFPEEVARACGRYYTTGIPEDTKALRSGALSEDEFLAQVNLVKAERFEQYRYALKRFDRGCLFFYFGHTDQLSHIFWRDRDPGHPAHDRKEAARYGTVIEDAYVEMDRLLGETLNVLDDEDTLIIVSDHGFRSFRHGFNLNTWLIENGYLAVNDPAQQDKHAYFLDVDWSSTRAYALGLNGLYVNLAGREQAGTVTEAERANLVREIAGKLLEERDADDTKIIESVYVVGEVYPGADPSVAPDIIVGYADTYRGSWATAEGGMPKALIEVNHDRWSGDHCMAHHLVPGILVTNRMVIVDDPALTDVAPTILGEFGIETPSRMTGRLLFSRSDR